MGFVIVGCVMMAYLAAYPVFRPAAIGYAKYGDGRRITVITESVINQPIFYARQPAPVEWARARVPGSVAYYVFAPLVMIDLKVTGGWQWQL